MARQDQIATVSFRSFLTAGLTGATTFHTGCGSSRPNPDIINLNSFFS
jgi:hypothetical protein